MIVVKATLQFVSEPHLAAIAHADLQSDDFTGGRLLADDFRNLQIAHEPAELVVIGWTCLALIAGDDYLPIGLPSEGWGEQQPHEKKELGPGVAH